MGLKCSTEFKNWTEIGCHRHTQESVNPISIMR